MKRVNIVDTNTRFQLTHSYGAIEHIIFKMKEIGKEIDENQLKRERAQNEKHSSSAKRAGTTDAENKVEKQKTRMDK